jgi:hypothetical protein
MKLRGLLFTGALATAFLLTGATTAEAHNTCLDRIHREEHKLQRDLRRHGWNSRQVQHRRQKIFRLRQQCGSSFFGLNRRNDRRWDRDDDWRWRDRRHDRDWDRRRWRRR